MNEATGRKRGITMRRLYPAGLQALLTIVRDSVPEPAVERGPYGPFLELIARDLDDWKRQRATRGHLVGMGMGSIYDTGGPSRRASAAEHEAFDRYYEALRWTHQMTYECAMRWHAKQQAGQPWTRADDRELVAELTGPAMQPYLSGICCRECDWVATNEAWIADAALVLETPYRLQLLVDLGGDAFARRLLGRPAGPDRAQRNTCQARVTEQATAQGVTVRSGAWHAETCPRCRGGIVGKTITLPLA